MFTVVMMFTAAKENHGGTGNDIKNCFHYFSSGLYFALYYIPEGNTPSGIQKNHISVLCCRQGLCGSRLYRVLKRNGRQVLQQALKQVWQVSVQQRWYVGAGGQVGLQSPWYVGAGGQDGLQSPWYVGAGGQDGLQ
jgi:hypothetical protein